MLTNVGDCVVTIWDRPTLPGRVPTSVWYATWDELKEAVDRIIGACVGGTLTAWAPQCGGHLAAGAWHTSSLAFDA